MTVPPGEQAACRGCGLTAARCHTLPDTVIKCCPDCDHRPEHRPCHVGYGPCELVPADEPGRVHYGPETCVSCRQRWPCPTAAAAGQGKP